MKFPRLPHLDTRFFFQFVALIFIINTSGPFTSEAKSTAFISYSHLNQAIETSTPDRLFAEADTYAQGANPNNNFGNDDKLIVRKSGNENWTRESFLRFDLSGKNAEVESARLELYVTSPSDPVDHEIYFVGDDNWEEQTLTWNRKPNPSGSALDVQNINAAGLVAFDVTTKVQEEISGDGKISFLLKAAQNVSPWVGYASKEHGTAGYRPQLVIEYTTTGDEPVTTLHINIDLGSEAATTSDNWNNGINGRVTGTNITNLKDDEGRGTGFNFVIATPADGNYEDDPNSPGVNTRGCTKCGYPSTATKDSYFAHGATPGLYKLTGLDNNKVYDITLFASRMVSGSNSLSRVGVYQIGAVSKTLDAKNNTSQTITFSGIVPQIGEISLSFRADVPNGFGYLNILEIKEIDPAGNGNHPGDISAPIIQPVSAQTLYAGSNKKVDVLAQAVQPVNTDNIKIVVLGSSSAEGIGASDPATTAWVPLLSAYMKNKYPGADVINLGKAGYTSYRIMPAGSTTPENQQPDPNRNITKAISLNPDIILINLPSNDVAKWIASGTTLDNFKTVKQLAEQEGIVVYITTTQPRHSKNFTTNMRLKLQQQAQMIRDAFGEDVIDIYDELATSDNKIKPIYDSGDHIHLNDAGHQYIFNAAKPMIDKLIKENMITLTAHNLPAFASTTNAGNGKLEIIFSPMTKHVNAQGTVNINATNGYGVSSQATFAYHVKASQARTISASEDKLIESTSFTAIPVFDDNATDALAKAGLKLFPNPAETQLYLKADFDRWSGAQVAITDAMGKNVAYYSLASENLAIDLRDKSAGLYLLMIRKNQDFFVLKFVKK